MARGVNKVILIGNLGGDPDTRYLPSGNAVTNITLATSDSWKDRQTGQQQERTEWHRVVFFGRLAEIAGQYLRKGSKVYIEGRLQTREWEKDGIKRYTTEIVVDMNGQMQMLDSRSDSGGYTPPPQGEERPSVSPPRPATAPREPAPQPAPVAAEAERPAPTAQLPTDSAPMQAFDNFDDDIPF